MNTRYTAQQILQILQQDVDSDSEDESVVEAAINQGSILITNNDITFLLFESVTETDDENETDNGSEGENDFVQGK